jgi:hypothetical protein
LPLAAGAERNGQGFHFMTKGQSVPDYVAIGFDKIERDLKFFIESLGEVLSELGLGELASHLPWFGTDPNKVDPAEVPAQLGLVYSIAFQLLNMVEENAALTSVPCVRSRRVSPRSEACGASALPN